MVFIIMALHTISIYTHNMFVIEATENASNVCREMGWYLVCKQKMTSFRGQASWAKVASPRVKLTAMACPSTKM